MTIRVFQIKPDGNIQIRTSASSLDLVTGSLPQGFYTTFSTLSQGTRVLGLQDHLDRLYLPAAELGLRPSVDETSLRLRIAELMQPNLPHESRVRLILAKDSGEIFVCLVQFQPLPAIVNEQGVHVITASLSRPDPRIKDTAFITESVSQRKLLDKDVFEVLLTKDGKILEGMTSNFYIIKKKTLITAQQGILLGVTRKAVLKLARKQGLSIKHRAPLLEEKFDEAFLTSSSRGVVPIVSIDDKSVGQGSVGKWVKALSKAYQVCVLERSEKIV